MNDAPIAALREADGACRRTGMGKSAEIHCPKCQQISLLLRSPVFEGLRKSGESLKCAGCGHVFGSEEEVPYTTAPQPSVFSDADRSKAVPVFAAGEADRLCRHCGQYVVNPFMQWCALHKKEVEATDSCNRFVRKEAAPSAGSGAPKRPAL